MAPPLTKPVPYFEGHAVIDGTYIPLKLTDYKNKYLLLIFYPLDFSVLCPSELKAFSEAYEDFQKNGCEILAISTDSLFSHLAWLKTPRSRGGLGELKFPLFSDKNMKISKAYGVLNEESGIPFRGIFIIDRSQCLRHVSITDLAVGRSVTETLRLVQGFQYSDAHGEVCLVDWTPGGKSLKMSASDSQIYLSVLSSCSSSDAI